MYGFIKFLYLILGFIPVGLVFGYMLLALGMSPGGIHYSDGTSSLFVLPIIYFIINMISVIYKTSSIQYGHLNLVLAVFALFIPHLKFGGINCFVYFFVFTAGIQYFFWATAEDKKSNELNRKDA